MSFRHEVFQEVGGFRSEIGRIRTRPMGCEETEFCIRLNQLQPHGLLLYEPRAKVRHQVPVERANWHYFIARCYAEGLSKAIVARFVGAQRSLSSERTYAFHTLPRGILRGVTDAIVRRDLAGLLRAAAIGIGLAATTLGYVWTMLSLRLGNKRASNSPVIVSGESTQA
jgi:hypothetical protein